jgi:NADH-quinone oxidoreductase subunit M
LLPARWKPLQQADFRHWPRWTCRYDVQVWLFWVLFLAFAIKLPIFPFHSWQPETYTPHLCKAPWCSRGDAEDGLYGMWCIVFPVVPRVLRIGTAR